MKKSLFLLILCLSVSSTIQAQDTDKCQKIGIARVNFIMMKLPEMKEIEAQIKEFEEQIQKQYDSKVKDFELKYNNYIENGETMPEVVRKDLEIELNTMQKSIEDYQQQAQISIVRKQNSLLQPVQKKVFESIEQIANKFDFSLILNYDISGVPIVLHYKDTFDISNQVLANLGINNN
ncbi:MAG: OmpH family outer membrane protein [Cytophagales bacterium]|nr:OmpH family outer membrane protein [Cytophagales bacterium]